MGLSVQPRKCLVWVLTSLPHGFVPLAEFCCPIGGIWIPSDPFILASFASFFLQKALGGDVWHVNVFPRLKDVQVAFGIIS